MKRVLIAGAGFAGMWAALGAARARRDLGATASDVRIDVVAPTPMLCLKPRLYERHAAFETDIAPLLASVDVGFVAGDVDAIDTARRQTVLRNGSNEPWDALVLATGSYTVAPPFAWQPHVHVLDGTRQALALRRHVTALPRRWRSAGRFTAVVIGAGFTGLEIATELAGWLRELATDANEAARIVLLDRTATAGATLGDGPQPAIIAALAETGVTFKPAATVAEISGADDAGDRIVTLADGQTIAAATVVWAAGMRAHPLGGALGTVDADGRLPVDATLRVAGHRSVFAAGDTARAPTAPGHHTLMSCQHAMPTGRVAGHNAVRVLADVGPIAYAQPAYATCLDLGPAGGVLTHGWDRNVVWTGADAKAVKRFINGRLIAPPPADNPDLALQLADTTPLPVADAAGVAARWRAMLGDAVSKAG